MQRKKIISLVFLFLLGSTSLFTMEPPPEDEIKYKMPRAYLPFWQIDFDHPPENSMVNVTATVSDLTTIQINQNIILVHTKNDETETYHVKELVNGQLHGRLTIVRSGNEYSGRVFCELSRHNEPGINRLEDGTYLLGKMEGEEDLAKEKYRIFCKVFTKAKEKRQNKYRRYNISEITAEK